MNVTVSGTGDEVAESESMTTELECELRSVVGVLEDGEIDVIVERLVRVQTVTAFTHDRSLSIHPHRLLDVILAVPSRGIAGSLILQSGLELGLLSLLVRRWIGMSVLERGTGDVERLSELMVDDGELVIAGGQLGMDRSVDVLEMSKTVGDLSLARCDLTSVDPIDALVEGLIEPVGLCA